MAKKDLYKRTETFVLRKKARGLFYVKQQI